MPFRSDKQRKFLYSQKPTVAKKFASHGKIRVVGSKKRKRGK